MQQTARLEALRAFIQTLMNAAIRRSVNKCRAMLISMRGHITPAPPAAAKFSLQDEVKVFETSSNNFKFTFSS